MNHAIGQYDLPGTGQDDPVVRQIFIQRDVEKKL
jgi:hypothetical protein